MFFRSLILVAILMLLLPSLLLAAGPVIVDLTADPATQPGLDQAANGVPIVNITAPSSRGVSHNRFSRYNVEQQGLILNNSQGLSQTQLGGYIDGNPNLDCAPARLILNEITGSEISLINGYTEVAGQSADLVLSNPNGIRVNGGGFINTPRVTLTTGQPQISSGTLSGFRVERGLIEIEGLGLNAANVNSFDIIARAIKINADLWARNLSLITGSNLVDALNLDSIPIPGSGNIPTFALDSTALGGMYADRIRLIGTEYGVGVRLASNMAATTAELIIELNGDLSLIDRARISTAGQLDLQSHSLDIAPESTIFAQGNVELVVAETAQNHGEIIGLQRTIIQAANLTNEGLIFSGNQLDFRIGQNLLNQTLDANLPHQKSAGIYAIGDISIEGIDNAPTSLVENTSATIESRDGSLNISAATLKNQRRYFDKNEDQLSSQSYALYPHEVVIDELAETIQAKTELTSEGVPLTIPIPVKYRNLSQGEGYFIDLTTGNDLGSSINTYVVNGQLYTDRANPAINNRVLLNRQESLAAFDKVGYTATIKTRTAGSGDSGNGETTIYYDLHIANHYPEEVRRELTVTEREEKIVLDSAPSGLFAGQNINLTADNLTNSISRIAAGKDVNITVSGLLSNQGESLRFINSKTGQYKYCSGTCNPWPWQSKEWSWAPLPEVRQETILKQIFSSISAGGNVKIAGPQSMQNGTIDNAALYSSDGVPSGTDATISVNQDLLQTNSRLFEYKVGNDHPFLIETRAEFTDLSNFIGSDYLLSRLGYNPLQMTKRLGDGFYETELVRNSLLEQTGRRFLYASISDDQVQFQLLMDNALAEAASLELVNGIDLSPEQVAALSRDIVWLVETEVMGETVLVPRIYLSKLTRTDLGTDESLISGRSIEVELAGDLVNYGGIDAIEDLTLIAEDSIINRGGQISGGNVQLLSKNGDIINERLTQQINRGNPNAGLEQTLVGDAGSITSRGNMSLNADNIRITGSTLNAAGTAQLVANNDIEIDSTTEQVKHHASADWGFTRSSKVRQYGSDIDSGTLLIAAGQDIAVTGSQLKSTGDTLIAAGGTISISAAQESDSRHSKQTTTGLFSKSLSEDNESKSWQKQSKVASGGSLMIDNSSSAKQNKIEIVASALRATDHLLLNTDGAVNISAAAETSQSYHQHSSSRFYVFSAAKAKGTEKSTLASSTLTAETGNLQVSASGDINQFASQLSAGTDIALQTITGSINIISGSDESSSFSEESSSSIGVFFGSGSLDFYRASSEKNQRVNRTNHASSLSASGDIQLASGEDVNLIGSSMQAGSEIDIQAARDFNILAASETDDSSTEKTEQHFGFSFSGDSNSFNAFAGYEQTKDRLDQNAQLSAASLIAAGTDLKINASQDILQIGSHLNAGQDVDLRAGGEIRSLSAVNSTSVHSYHEQLRAGISSGMNYNLGQAADSVKAVGSSGNALTAASRGLRAIDAIDSATQPSVEMFFGLSGASSSSSSIDRQAVASSITAGRDLSAAADGDIEMEGSLLSSGRDMKLTAEDIRLLAARGSSSASSSQENWKAGLTIKGSKSTASYGGGFSGSGSDQENDAELDSPVMLQAGNNLDLTARKNTELEGTQANAGQDIVLIAGEKIDLHAAQGKQTSNTNSHAFGVEIGLSTSETGTGAYLTANAARSDLDRNGTSSILTNLNAAEHLQVTSGGDTQIRGGKLKGKTVTVDVGGDLLVASLANTGTVDGDNWSAGGTINTNGSVGFNANVGKTSGSKDWVDQQTSIIAEEALNIAVEGHTQLDAAVIASETGDLRLETGSFAYSDFSGHDKETSVSAGFGTSKGPGTGKHSNAGADHSGSNWSAEGGYSNKDRQQILRATIGDGGVIVRQDAENGSNSSEGLNRELGLSYEITKDESSDYELYASGNSLKAVEDPVQKVGEWRTEVASYGRNMVKAVKNIDELTKESKIAAKLVGGVNTLGQFSLGIMPSRKNHGGIATQLPVLISGDMDFYKVTALLEKDPETTKIVLKEYGYEEFNPQDPKQIKLLKAFSDYAAANGIQNDLKQAIKNGAMQTGAKEFIQMYNPEHGLLGDLLECTVDTLLGGVLQTGTARNEADFFSAVDAAGFSLNVASHSQGALLTYRALGKLELKPEWNFQFFGAPVKSSSLRKNLKNANVSDKGSYINLTNDPALLGVGAKNDSVSTIFGRNAKSISQVVDGILSIPSLFGKNSAHSFYLCQGDFCAGTQQVITEYRTNLPEPTNLNDSKGQP